MAANLKGRLARLRALGLVKAAELEVAPGPDGGGSHSPARGQAARSSRGDPPSFLGGWEKVGELAWTRTLRYPSSLPESVDPSVFAPLRRSRAALGAAAMRAGARVDPAQAGSAPPGRIPAGQLRFFDLETTGLSGGAGTVAFLAAVARLEDGEFALTQFFLEDFPGEGAFLAGLLPFLGGDAAVVSYNGRAFDMPLLRTRCVMNGMEPPQPSSHIDALFASRRLWKRVHGGASLGLLEREVLGIERLEDLPGAMIPEAWLAFAREGDNPLMPLVLSHNAADVVGLARLLSRAQSVFDDPRSRLAGADVDRAGLGRTLLSAGRHGEGEELLEAAAGDGDEGAGLLVAARYRRAARVEDFLRVAAMLPASYRCAVEGAKLHEREVGDLGEAERWASEALRLAPAEADREAATRRLARIRKKLAGNAGKWREDGLSRK